MADTSLQSAIAEAHHELSAAATTPAATAAQAEETQTEETQTEEIAESETSEETTEGETTSESADLSEAQLTEARNLYKALSGPQANAIIAALAAQAGILPKAGETPLTKKEETAAQREIKDIFSEALGKEYSFLADRLGPAIEAVLKQERETSESRFAEIQQSNVEREVVASYNDLATETKGVSKQFEARMAQLSEEVPIGNMNVKTYMRRLYAIASSERKSSPQKVADQIRRNASDVPARLRSAAGPAGNTLELPNKKMSLNDSVAWAADQISKRK